MLLLVDSSGDTQQRRGRPVDRGLPKLHFERTGFSGTALRDVVPGAPPMSMDEEKQKKLYENTVSILSTVVTMKMLTQMIAISSYITCGEQIQAQNSQR